MFSFDLPESAALHVILPTGTETILVHAGGGRFVSKVPPIVLAGLVRAGQEAGAEGVPVAWDGKTLPGDGESQTVAFGFDVQAAAEAVRAAAAEGDTYARAVVAELEHADRTLAARQALLNKSAAQVGECGQVCGDCGQQACGVAGKDEA